MRRKHRIRRAVATVIASILLASAGTTYLGSTPVYAAELDETQMVAEETTEEPGTEMVTEEATEEPVMEEVTEETVEEPETNEEAPVTVENLSPAPVVVDEEDSYVDDESPESYNAWLIEEFGLDPNKAYLTDEDGYIELVETPFEAEQTENDDIALYGGYVADGVTGTVGATNPLSGRNIPIVGHSSSQPEFIDCTLNDGSGKVFPVYCIQMDAVIRHGNTLQATTFKQGFNNLTDDQIRRVNRIMGFMTNILIDCPNGYTYEKRSEYWTNQCLIWWAAGQLSYENAVATLNQVKGSQAVGNSAEFARIAALLNEYENRPSIGAKTSTSITADYTYKLSYNAATGMYEAIVHDTSGMLANGRMKTATCSNPSVTFTQCNADGSANGSGEYLKIASSAYINQNTPVTVTQTKKDEYTPCASDTCAFFNGVAANQKCIIATSKAQDPVSVYFNIYTDGMGQVNLNKRIITNSPNGTGDVSLAGAVYGVYATAPITMLDGTVKNAGDLVGTIETDAAGNGVLNKIPLSTYTVKELIAPAGMTIDSNSYTAVATTVNGTATIDGQAVAVANADISSGEGAVTTSYHIRKYTVEDATGTTTATPLKNCEFAMYLKSSLDQSELATKGIANYNYTAATPVVTGTTDENGDLTFNDLFYGTYIVVETRVGSPKYAAITPYEVTLPVADGAGYKGDVYETLVDEWIYARLRVEKLDEATGNTIIGNATYKIKSEETGKYLSLNVLTTDGMKKVDTFTTNADGYFYFYDKIPAGDYVLEEQGTSSGIYGLENIKFTVSADGIRYVRLDADGNVIGAAENAEKYLDANGTLLYTIKAYDAPKRVSVEKVDIEGNRITGALLGITKSVDGKPETNADGSFKLIMLPQMENGRPVVDNDGNAVLTEAKWLSENAFETVNYLTDGDYFLVELDTPKGYVTAEPIPFTVSEEVEHVTINGADTTINHADQSLTMIDKSLVVKISKRDIANDNELPGAELELIDKDGNVIDSWTSGRTEHTVDSSLLKAGESYTLKEVFAPKYYDIANSITFTVKDDGSVQTVVMYDEIVGRVRVEKTGPFLTGTKTLKTIFGDMTRLEFDHSSFPGITFGVFNAETNEMVTSFTTTADSEIAYSEYIPVGNGEKYYLMEIETPAGLVQSTEKIPVDITFNADRDEYISDIVKIDNDVVSAKVRIYKEGEVLVPNTTDSFGIARKGVKDVYFGVYTNEDLLDKDGNVLVKKDTLVGVNKTNEEGLCEIVESLVAGKYYFKELKAAEGYVIDDSKQEFEITYQRNTQTKEVVIETNIENPLLNRLYYAKVTINKHTTGGSPLSGVEFTLFRTNEDGSEEALGVYKTDANGQIIVTQLPYGSYYFRETKGLSGYTWDANKKYEVKVEAKDGQNFVIDVVNDTTPRTGDDSSPDALLPVLFALSVTGMLSTMYLCISLKNEESERERKKLKLDVSISAGATVLAVGMAAIVSHITGATLFASMLSMITTIQGIGVFLLTLSILAIGAVFILMTASMTHRPKRKKRYNRRD